MKDMHCPVCRAVYRPPSGSCRRCGVDLLPLIEIRDRAIWYHKQALDSLARGDFKGSIVDNQKALALHRGNADFHVLAGRLQALEGNLKQAIANWQYALSLDPQHPQALKFLQILTGALPSR